MSRQSADAEAKSDTSALARSEWKLTWGFVGCLSLQALWVFILGAILLERLPRLSSWVGQHPVVSALLFGLPLLPLMLMFANRFGKAGDRAGAEQKAKKDLAHRVITGSATRRDLDAWEKMLRKDADIRGSQERLSAWFLLVVIGVPVLLFCLWVAFRLAVHFFNWL